MRERERERERESNLLYTKEHCMFSGLTIIGKLFQVLAICHFYEQCGRKLGLWVVWPENNEPLKMIVIDDLSAVFSYGANRDAAPEAS